MINTLLLVAALVFAPVLPSDTIVRRATVAGGTDYTDDAETWEWHNLDSTGTDVCDGNANSNNGIEIGTLTHVTSGTGLQEGSGAVENVTTTASCVHSNISGLPHNCTGAGCDWSVCFKYTPVGSTGVNASEFHLGSGTTAATNSLLLRRNSNTQADWRIGSTNIANQHTIALNTEYSICVTYDFDQATEWNFYWDGGNGGACSGSSYTNAAAVPAQNDDAVFPGGSGTDVDTIIDDVIFRTDVLTQADACNIHQDCAKGNCA